MKSGVTMSILFCVLMLCYLDSMLHLILHFCTMVSSILQEHCFQISSDKNTGIGFDDCFIFFIIKLLLFNRNKVYGNKSLEHKLGKDLLQSC